MSRLNFRKQQHIYHLLMFFFYAAIILGILIIVIMIILLLGWSECFYRIMLHTVWAILGMNQHHQLLFSEITGSPFFQQPCQQRDLKFIMKIFVLMTFVLMTVVLMTVDFDLIQRWPLRSIFAQFPEQLFKDLVSWGNPGECSVIDGFLSVAFGVLSC